MTPWSSSSLAWFSLLTAFLLGYEGTFALFGSTASQLCDKWKSDPAVVILAMGIITDANGESRFYAVSSEFEGLTVPADALTIPEPPGTTEQPAQRDGDSPPSHPTVNLTDAETLDLTNSQASWPTGETNGKGAFILAFKPDAGFHAEDKFLASISPHSHELLLVSLKNPEAPVLKFPISGEYQPPSRIVFSADNKFAPSSDATVLATVRFLNAEETDSLDYNLRKEEETLRFESLNIAPPNQIKGSLGIEGGFLLNGHSFVDARLFALNNGEHKIYLFYPGEVEPVEVPLADFLLCPEGGLTPLKAGLGIGVPVILIIGAVFFYMASSKSKAAAPQTVSTVGNTSTGGRPGQSARASPGWVSGSTWSLAKLKTRTPGKPRTSRKTSKKKPSRSHNKRSPGTKAGFKPRK